jgi:hypothetical protein
MAMKVHGAPWRDMDHFIIEYARLNHNRQSKYDLSLSFYIHFFTQHVSITLQHALTYLIEKNITLTCDDRFRPHITIRSHDLHANDIKGSMGEIASYHERD